MYALVDVIPTYVIVPFVVFCEQKSEHADPITIPSSDRTMLQKSRCQGSISPLVPGRALLHRVQSGKLSPGSYALESSVSPSLSVGSGSSVTRSLITCSTRCMRVNLCSNGDGVAHVVAHTSPPWFACEKQTTLSCRQVFFRLCAQGKLKCLSLPLRGILLPSL